VYKKYYKTETVTETVEMSDGTFVSETRPWSTARDRHSLTREQTHDNKTDTLQTQRVLVLTLIFKHCTSSLISAVEQEPTYAAAHAATDSLQLYLLMEKV
jgi:hypothetical protein